MQNSDYRLLCKFSEGKILRYVSEDGCRGGDCPAVLEDGDYFIVIGERLNDAGLKKLSQNPCASVNERANEVAIRIKRELLFAAAEEAKVAAL